MEARLSRPLPTSNVSWLDLLVPEERQAFLQSLTRAEKAVLNYRWSFWARPNQTEPAGDWRVWMVLAGRGFGKTRVGAEWVRSKIEGGVYGRCALVAATAADARDVMIEGESGLLSVCPPWNRPIYQSSKRRLTWPNGATATLYSAEEPDRLRGPQHDCAWCDEAAAWGRPDTWDMLMFGLRLGEDPRCVVTTTPKAVRLVREIKSASTTVTTMGTTYDNRANLAPAFFADIVRKYEGTRLGRQELEAELLEDNPGSLWKRERIEQLRVAKAPDMIRIVVAIDPSASSGSEAAECGIVAVGLGRDGHGYVLEDASLRGSPNSWATAAVRLYERLGADRIVAEVNNGGEMVEAMVRTVNVSVPYKAVHATRGKAIRAEPISAFYEQGRAHHVGAFPQLEDQMCQWEPGEISPDRMDALVWALTELMVTPEHGPLDVESILYAKR